MAGEDIAFLKWLKESEGDTSKTPALAAGEYPGAIKYDARAKLPGAITYDGAKAQIPGAIQYSEQSQTPEARGAEPPVQVQTFGGIDAGAGGREDLEGQGALRQAELGIFQGMYGPTGMAGTVMDEGENYLPFGGPQGKKNVEETYFNQPERMAQAVTEGAKAQQQESEEKQKFYAVQRDRTRDYEAALKEQYMLRQNEMMARQQEMEVKTKAYTDDLANKGAFWHNPQNVIAAFSAALMQLTTDDRSFGYKLLNGAIQNDLQNRRHLADQHMGYLKSNMAEYDRIAGDRIAGMQLAESEAKRVAAIELERIAAQFQGPKAKANAEAIISKLKIDAMEGYMRAYQAGIYNKAHIENRAIAASLQKTGKAVPGVGYHSYAGGIPGAPAGAPGGPVGPGAKGGQGGGMAVPGAPRGGPAGPAPSGPGMAPRGAAALSPGALKALEDRFPGATDAINNGFESVQQAGYLAAGVRPGTPEQMMSPAQRHAFNTAVQAERKAAYESFGKVSANLKGLASRNAGLRMIQTDAKLLEQATSQYGLKMDDVLSSKTRTVLGNETLMKLNQLYEAHIKSDPEHASKWENQRNAVNAAASRFMQLLAGDISEYNKSIGGAALTAIELPRLKQYADASAPWSHIINYIESESNKAHAEERSQFQQMTPAAQAMWLIQLGQKQTPIQSQSVDAPPKPGTKHSQGGAPGKTEEFKSTSGPAKKVDFSGVPSALPFGNLTRGR